MDALLALSQASSKEVKISITGSKSETNRLLILQALYPSIKIENTSNSDDSRALTRGLSVNKGVVDIHHAGTAMRFLTAYFASQPGKEVILTGSQRMQERPIGILVEALRAMGADIEYTSQEGYPPLAIMGKALTAETLNIKADTSSQYISALMLIAPSLPQGLTIHLQGKVTSVPYIEMTLSLLRHAGAIAEFDGSRIRIEPMSNIEDTSLVVESDWSSASYYYSLVALSEDLKVSLRSYKANSLQGDSALVRLYAELGVTTEFDQGDHSILLKKATKDLPASISWDLANTPDLAQTIAVSCFGLGIACDLTGLHTLKIKETDRLEALKEELWKLGADIQVTDHSLHLKPSSKVNPGVAIETYHDHRMAMAFAPLALKAPLVILDSSVVTKSYPGFWEDMAKAGLQISFE